MGTPVITTDYSAHTEFCNNNNSYLVNIDSNEDAYDGKWFFGQGEWANLGNSQIDQCIEHMRDVYKNKPYNKEGEKTGKRFNWKSSAEKLVKNIS